jgi:hypothetical protein
MAAAQYDFEIEQGATLLKPIVWKDSTGAAVDLTGYTARMQVRRSTSAPDVLIELSSANGKISISALTGTVTLIFSATTTAAFDWRRGKYDLELVAPDGIVTRLVEGEIAVSREVTR